MLTFNDNTGIRIYRLAFDSPDVDINAENDAKFKKKLFFLKKQNMIQQLSDISIIFLFQQQYKTLPQW